MNPKFREIFEKIENDIRNGVYDKTRKLHSEEEYVAMYSVSRVTVRHAIDQLIRRGYCYPVQGKGVFLRRNPISGAFNLENVHGLSSDLPNLKVTSKVVSIETISADAIIAERIGVQIGAPLSYVERVRYGDGSPISFERIYLNSSRISVSERVLRNSLFEYLRQDLGIQLAFIDYEIYAVKINEVEAKHLDLNVGDPGFAFESVVMDRKGSIIFSVKAIYHYQRMRALKMASYL